MREDLRRYINIPALIYLLTEQKLSLLSPDTWDDKNDSHFLQLYKEAKGLKSLLAACFTDDFETYHHWRVFTDGESGACVIFDRARLLGAMDNYEGIRHSQVEYLTLKVMRAQALALNDLPFRKRWAFQHESEYRIIHESTRGGANSLRTKDFPIPLACIRRVAINPWMTDSLFDHLASALRRIDGCSDIDITRSTLISNDQWKRYGEASVRRPSQARIAKRYTQARRHKR